MGFFFVAADVVVVKTTKKQQQNFEILLLFSSIEEECGNMNERREKLLMVFSGCEGIFHPEINLRCACAVNSVKIVIYADSSCGVLVIRRIDNRRFRFLLVANNRTK